MKRAITILLALGMLLSLAACGGAAAKTENTDSAPAETEAPAAAKEDFYGEWENYETGDTLTIDAQNLTLQQKHGGSSVTNWQIATIEGYTLKAMFGELTLTEVDGKKQLVGEIGTFITTEEANQRRESESIPLGGTYSGACFEITVKSAEYADLLGKENTTRLFVRDVSWDNPGDGKVFMIIKFDYTNLAKRTVDMARDVKFTIVYKDGYEFVSFEETKAYIFVDDINGAFRQCCLDSGGYVMELSPLTNGSFFIAIPVAAAVSTDTESPIRLRIEYGENIKGGAFEEETAYFVIQ